MGLTEEGNRKGAFELVVVTEAKLAELLRLFCRDEPSDVCLLNLTAGVFGCILTGRMHLTEGLAALGRQRLLPSAVRELREWRQFLVLYSVVQLRLFGVADPQFEHQHLYICGRNFALTFLEMRAYEFEDLPRTTNLRESPSKAW